MKKTVSAESLLKLIPEELLEQLSAETLVDYQVKKLKGCILFKLLLYSILKTEKISQRVIEHFFNSRQFQFLAGFEVKKSTKHTSLSDRLASIEVSFFEQLHNSAPLGVPLAALPPRLVFNPVKLMMSAPPQTGLIFSTESSVGQCSSIVCAC